MASKLKRNIFFQYLLQIAIYVFPFLTLPYLTRALGSDVYAVRAYAVSAMGLLSAFVGYGFNAYGTREVALHRGNLAYLKQLTTSIFVMRVGLALLGAIVVAALIPHTALMAQNPEYMLITYVGSCLTAMLPDFVFQGMEDMSVMTKRYVGSRIVSVALIFAFVHGPGDIILVAIFEASASVIAFAWSWLDVVLKRKISFDFKHLAIADMARCLKSSTAFFLSNASTTIFTGLTTVVIGIYVHDVSQVSYWSISMTAITAVQALYAPIANSLYPHVISSGSFKAAKRFLIAGMPAVLIGTVVFFLLSDTVMLVLGGSSYLEGSNIVRLVSPVLLFSYPSMVIGFPVLAAAGKEVQLTASSLVAAVFHIAGLCVLVAVGGFSVAHVAVLRSATEFVMMALRSAFVIRWARERRRGSVDERRE